MTPTDYLAIAILLALIFALLQNRKLRHQLPKRVNGRFVKRK